MDSQEMQRRCEAMLKELGCPSFIVFGYQREGDQFSVVSSFHDMPPQAAVKGMSWALHDYISKSL
jgi:hypothetical protein